MSNSKTYSYNFSKQILLKPSQPRDIRAPVLPSPAVAEVKKEEKQKSKTPAFFKPAAAAVQVKKESPAEQKKKTPVKTDKPSPSAEKLIRTAKTEKSPAEATKTEPSKKPAAKNQKPVQKSSISSFFSNKPAATSSTSSVPSSTKVVKDEPKTLKREKSPELIEDSQDEPPKKMKKKLKLKELPNNKRSRIRVIEDSSEDDEEEQHNLDEPESKFIKFDREVTPDNSQERQEPKKVVTSPTPNQPADKNKRRKAKRTVKKRFMTAGGFMRTEDVVEEYSVSEDEAENDENRKKNSPEVKKSEKKVVPVVPAEAKSSEKKKSAKNAKPTQSNKITNFFTKK